MTNKPKLVEYDVKVKVEYEAVIRVSQYEEGDWDYDELSAKEDALEEAENMAVYHLKNVPNALRVLEIERCESKQREFDND